MRLVVASSAEEFGVLAADIVQAQLEARPDSVLALPTGSTPLGLYAQLRARSAAGACHLDKVRCFNLDEYVGLASADPSSYGYFLDTQLFQPARVPRANIRLLRGDAGDLNRECLRYDAALEAAGGIDLAILGLGANGHIAFNEPGTPWNSGTHVVRLASGTRAANARMLPPGQSVPRLGITMGIGTLLKARSLLLLVSDKSKRAALAALLGGTPDLAWPATSLYAHPALVVICAPRLDPPVPNPVSDPACDRRLQGRAARLQR